MAGRCIGDSVRGTRQQGITARRFLGLARDCTLCPVFSLALPVIMGIVLALLTSAIDWLRTKYHYADTLADQTDESVLWLKRWYGAVVRWAGKMGFEILPHGWLK